MSDFGLGVIVGVFGAWILAAFFQWIRAELDKAGAANRPQVVIQRTSKTPAKVVQESLIARLNLIFLFVVFVGGLVCSIRLFFK